MHKMRAITLFIILMLITALVGCSSSSSTGTNDGTQETPATGGTTGKKTTLNYWTYVGLHTEFYKNAVDEWNKKNPDRQIELKPTVYAFEEMHNKLLLSVQSGVGAPDISDVDWSYFANFMKGDKPAFLQLDDIVNPVKDKMIQSRLNIYTKNNHYYGLPTLVGATVMYYNKEILDKAGVNADDIKTWNDFVEAGKKVRAATGKPITTFEAQEVWQFMAMALQQDSGVFDKDGKVILDNAANVKALSAISDMIHKSKVADIAPGSGHHSDEYFAYMNKGESASVMMPMWYMGRFLEYMPNLKGKMIIRPMPAWDNGGKRSAGLGGTATVVTNQSKNQQLAKDFIAFAKLTPEANINIWKTLGFEPPRSDVWDSPEMKANNKFTDYFGTDIFDTLLKIKDEINSPVPTEQTTVANNLLRTSVIFKAINEQSLTPEKALKSAADELRKGQTQ
jgi:arabinosaccharide transport system substrate-binding protein